MIKVIENEEIRIVLDVKHCFIRIEDRAGMIKYSLEAPRFEVDGKYLGGSCFSLTDTGYARLLANGGTEFRLQYNLTNLPDVNMTLCLRHFPGSPFIRYRYELRADNPVTLTKKTGGDRIKYTGFKSTYKYTAITELQLGQFENTAHAYLPNFQPVETDELAAGIKFPGPVVIAEGKNHCCLLAYEHGFEYPEAYLTFSVIQDEEKTEILVNAEKGNYFAGQIVDSKNAFISPWFHFALCVGKKTDLLHHYRTYFLKFICENLETRKPYICYNTWNNQERDCYLRNKTYMDAMNLEHILKEIDIAHKMGIDIFVIDAGWSKQTGLWEVNEERFSDGLKSVKEKLNRYGMKLGLWFFPAALAKASPVHSSNPEYLCTFDGKRLYENEERSVACLASDYADVFIEKMVRLNRQLGVTYYKWDGGCLNDCNSPLHNHGTEANSPQERLDCYGYRSGMEMIRIVEEVNRRCPGIIFDFDVTEDERAFGLGLLSVGRYFMINNGPYTMDFDVPQVLQYSGSKTSVQISPTTNIFFFPGAARSRICRQGLKYDSFIPSILFMVHFLPDQPLLSQMNSLASLMLGGNAVWGDLLSLTEDDIRLFSDTLAKYKIVAKSITESYPRVKGFIGASPEIYEKIDYAESIGMVCFFTKARGTFVHVTKKISAEKFSHADGADCCELTEDGRLKITVALNKNEARPVFIFSK